MSLRTLYVVVPTIVALSMFALAVAQLYAAHPHEDAYIAFTYVENLAAGHGIVFYPGGPRTEGVTDFLWLLVLAVFVRFGLDVALAAGLLNALGAALAAALFEREVVRCGAAGTAAAALAMFPLVLPFVGGGLAAQLGFSSMLYGALSLALFVLVMDGAGRALPWVPVLAFVVALFRPDGVAIGAVFTLLGLVQARSAGRLLPYLLSTFLAVGAGLAYWAGRYAYFGLVLPLPLYVKWQGTTSGPVANLIVAVFPWLRGIGGNLQWLKSPLGPAPILAVGALVALFAWKTQSDLIRRLTIGLTPFLALLLLLSLANQHQNIHFRFQAPVFLALLFALFRLTAEGLQRAGRPIHKLGLVLLLWLAIACPLFGGFAAIRWNWQARSYIDVFPAHLAAALERDRTLAVTEAGRLPYWVRTRTFDIVGLNNADTAREPVGLAYLEQIDPDLVLFNAIYSFDLVPGLDPSGTVFSLVPASLLATSVRPRYQNLFAKGFADSADSATSTNAAPVVLGRYLVDHESEYQVIVMRHKGSGAHVVGVRKSLPEAAKVLAALEDSSSGKQYETYAYLKHFVGARLLDARVDAYKSVKPGSASP
jgi:hypothetical protein